MQLEVRNPKYNAVGSIDIEINHPVAGWIWFTASPNDVEPHGRALYEQAVAGTFGPVAGTPSVSDA